MFFRKSPKRIGKELGKIIFSEPIIDTLLSKSRSYNCEMEVLSIIAFARLVGIKYFFPIDQRYADPWATLSSVLDDYYFECVENSRSDRSYPLNKMGKDDEVYAVCSECNISFVDVVTRESEISMDFCTFIGSAVPIRYDRYLTRLNSGMKSNPKGFESIDSYFDLAEAVSEDLSFLFEAKPEDEILGSIAPAIIHGLSVIAKAGYYRHT